MNYKAREYAQRKTGYFETLSSLWNTIGKIRKEREGRLCVTNEGDFDDIVNSLITRFDTEKILSEAVENYKKNNS